MERYYFDVEKDKIMELLAKELSDPELAERICFALAELCMQERCEKRTRQMEGIRKAKESGVVLGRPQLRVPDNFEELLAEWENGKLRAAAAAEACGMGISTFYRKARNYHTEKQKDDTKQK